MMASKDHLFGDDTALSAILASDDPREQKRLFRQVRHFDPELWQSECENIVFYGNFVNFSQNEEMNLALIQTGDRRLAEASPHDNLWGIGLSACDPRASSSDSWCGQNLLGQASEHAREILRRDITALLSNSPPDTLFPRDDTGDTVFEVDPVTHLRLDTDPPCANTQMAALSAFTDLVPDDHAPEVLLAQEPRIDAPLIPEQGPDLISGVVTMPTPLSLLYYRSIVESRRRLGSTVAPSWTQDPPNPSSIKELSTKWPPRALLMRLASDPPRLERGAVSDPDSCSAPTDKLE